MACVLTKDTGYGEAAVKLQRDWKLDPQSLPLAKHIKGGALVRLIKYGLRYYYTDQIWDRVSSVSAFIEILLTAAGVASMQKDSISIVYALFWTRICTTRFPPGGRCLRRK